MLQLKTDKQHIEGQRCYNHYCKKRQNLDEKHHYTPSFNEKLKVESEATRFEKNSTVAIK